MKPEHKPQYYVVKTEHFITRTQDLQKRYGRLLHLLQAIDWALARRPHHFSNVTGEYYLLKTGGTLKSRLSAIKNCL
jgi:hypothetical protein